MGSLLLKGTNSRTSHFVSSKKKRAAIIVLKTNEREKKDLHWFTSLGVIPDRQLPSRGYGMMKEDLTDSFTTIQVTIKMQKCTLPLLQLLLC